MTVDRPTMISIIRNHADPEFQSEVRYFTDDIGDREGAYDEVSALFDIESRNEEKEGDKRLLRIARTMLIEIGFYRVMPAEEIANTYTSSGRSPWAFKLHGLAYTFDEPASCWQFPDDPDDDQNDG